MCERAVGSAGWQLKLSLDPIVSQRPDRSAVPDADVGHVWQAALRGDVNAQSELLVPL